LTVVAVLGTTFGLSAQQYEIDGKIELRLSHFDRSLWKLYDGNFRVCVNDCAWLVQITETNDFGTPHRREVGTRDGKEIFEMTVPYEPIFSSDVILGSAKAGRIRPTAFLSSNTIPVGSLDSSFTGHLWLMFASSCYFRTAAPGELTPVFDYRATPSLNPSTTLKANWKLLEGPGSLPASVTYFGPDGTPSAVYTMTGFTNIGAMALPTGFHFSQPGTGYKEVSAVVTAIRPTCSLSDLRPAVKQQMIMVDLRWHPGDPGVRFTTYTADYWPTVKQAQGIYYSTRSGAAGAPVHSPSSLMIVILVGLLIAPPVFLVLQKLQLRPNLKP
jgi:hypothetical protein